MANLLRQGNNPLYKNDPRLLQPRMNQAAADAAWYKTKTKPDARSGRLNFECARLDVGWDIRGRRFFELRDYVR